MKEQLPPVLQLVEVILKWLPQRARWALLRALRRMRERMMPDPLHVEWAAFRDAYLDLHRQAQRVGRESGAAAVGGNVGHSDPTAREVVRGARINLVDAALMDLLRQYVPAPRLPRVGPCHLEEPPAPEPAPELACDVYALQTIAAIRSTYTIVPAAGGAGPRMAAS